MADTIGQADLRGLDVDKLIKGFENESFVFKNNLTVTPTANREIRWFQRLGPILLDSTDTTGITTSQIKNTWGTLPPIAELGVSRMTSYVQHFSIESPWFNNADLKDTDPDMFAANLRELRRAIESAVDIRIYDTLSGTCLLSGSAAGTGWADATNGNPFMDLLSGSTEIRKKGYDINNLVAWVHPDQYKNLFNYFITTKGSSVPVFSSGKVADGVITKIANVGIIVSNNATAGGVPIFVPQRAATWKEFTPLRAVPLDDPRFGKKIFVEEDGEVIFTDPHALYLLKSA